MVTKGLVILLSTFIGGLLIVPNAWPASKTTVYDIREGLHSRFTRLVFDSGGAPPTTIGPATSDGIRVQFEQLNLKANLKRLGTDRDSAVAKVSLVKERKTSVILISFRHPNTEVKTFFLEAERGRKGTYRLVMDFYPSAGRSNKGAVAASAFTLSKKQPEKGPKSAQVLSQDETESDEEESSESEDSETEVSTEKPLL